MLEKVDEELAELRHALKTKDEADIEEELGDLLFAVTNAARFTAVDPENALRKTIGKFINRFHFIEKELVKNGSSLTEASLMKRWKSSGIERRRNQEYKKNKPLEHFPHILLITCL